jgi:iron complex outermembrane receptor protein
MIGINAHATVIEEVVVTAQKREQNLQDVPITMQALSEGALKQAGAHSTDDLSVVAPGLTSTRVSGAATFFIRGVGTNNAAAGNEGSVAMYVDGVYNPTVDAAVMDFVNVQRVEVLKGPQGTLFGRNAVGGLIHIITKDPSFNAHGSVSALISNYDTYGGQFYGTSGLTESLAADISVLYRDQREGYGYDPGVGKKTMLGDVFALRNKWLYEISESTQAIMSFSYTESDSDVGLPMQPVKGSTTVNGDAYSGDFYRVSNTEQGQVEKEAETASLTISHSFDEVELVSITAYQNAVSEWTVDGDGGETHLLSFHPIVDNNSYTQELRLVSDNDSALEWMSGLYYFDTDFRFKPVRIGGMAVHPLEEVVGNTKVDSKSYAIFGEARYSLNDQTGITLGLRWTKDDLKHTGKTIFVPLAEENQPPAYKQEDSFEEPTWRLGTDHHFTDSLMVFASYSRGYKAGFYNTVVDAGVPQDIVDPEILDAYEFGWKGKFFNNALTLNGSFFYYDYQDIQVVIRTETGNLNQNAAEATSQGFELDANYFPVDSLQLNLGLSYIDSEYDDYPNAPLFTSLPSGGNDGEAVGSLSGNELLQTPELTVSLGALFMQETALGEVLWSLSYYYRDEFYWQADHKIKESSLNMLNASVEWTSPDSRYSATLWAKNILDEEYALWAYSTAIGDTYAPAPPHTYGLKLEYHF